MLDAPLYLFKTTRRPLYRRENLNLLAAERGTVHEYAWNRSWISPTYFEPGPIGRGTRVFFLFAERPYRRFVSVRDGQVVSADWDETLLRMRVLLNNPVAVEDVDLATVTHVVKKQAGSGNAAHRIGARRGQRMGCGTFGSSTRLRGQIAGAR